MRRYDSRKDSMGPDDNFVEVGLQAVFIVCICVLIGTALVLITVGFMSMFKSVRVL